MINFLPISILAYALNGGAILISKVQLQTAQLSPVSYTFYGSLMQVLVIFLIPFGFNLNLSPTAIFSSIISGVVFVFALYALFKALDKNEVSVVGPVVGALNPFFALVLGFLLLNEILTSTQLMAFFLLITGTLTLTFNLWSKQFKFNYQLLIMIGCGFLFGLSYIFLRQAFLQTSFINGLVISRMAAGVFVLSFLLVPSVRNQLFGSNAHKQTTQRPWGSLLTTSLFLSGQTMSGLSNFLLFFATSLSSPALVNSLFGVQYLIILVVALVLTRKHPQLLDENLSKGVLVQKLAGAGILSWGVYLLSR